MRKNKYWLSRHNAYATEHLENMDIKVKSGWSKWGSMPLLIFAFIQGLPIDGQIVNRDVLFAEQVFERTQASSTSLGYESTIVPSLIFGGIYLFALMVLVRSSRSLSVVGLLRFWPLSLQVLLMGISLVWVEYAGKVALNVVHNIGVIGISLAAAIHFRQEPWRLLSVLGIALGLNIVIHMLVVLLLPNVGITIDGRWAGFFSNSNSFGAIAYCAVWANAVAITFTKNLLRLSHVVTLFITALALAGSESASAMLSAIVALGVFFILRGSYRRNAFAVVISALLLAIMAFIYEAFFSSQTIFELLGKSSDLSGRTLIWAAGYGAFLSRPFFGWGFDDNAYVNQITGMVHHTYHNGYLDLAVRGGLVSLALFVAIIVIGIRAVLRTPTSTRSLMIPIYFPFIFSVLIYNISEVSFFEPRNIIWVILLTILFLAVMQNVHLRRSIY
jgi:O-antigen ligase